MLVSTAPLTTRFEHLRCREGLTSKHLARKLEWYRDNGRPDHARVNRTLAHTTVRYSTAVQLAFALGLDPHEAGV